jgi:hypothetical protein
VEAGRGLRIGKPLKEFHGVLTGLPVFHGTADDVIADPDAKK